jgi:ABC-type transporter Mla maintaining outer membrane lipid asymmetry ATPase subunit MlaF
MIHAVELKHFRCFDNFRLEGLKPFTLLVGGSGSGKTAVLEALFLACGGSAEVALRTRVRRGFRDDTQYSTDAKSNIGLFRDLFRNGDVGRPCVVGLEDASKRLRSLEITCQESDIVAGAVDSSMDLSQFTASVPFAFHWTTAAGAFSSKIQFRDGRVQIPRNSDVYPGLLFNSQAFSSAETAKWYSELSRDNREGQVLRVLQALFPDVSGLSLELVCGEPMLHAAVHGMPEKMPVVVLSGGITKFMSIALGILSLPRGGVVLVDEIENGFYYESLAYMIEALWKLGDQNGVQVISTTHSYEFLRATAQVMERLKSSEGDMALVRFERGRGGKQPTARVVAGKNYRAAIESDFEVR